MNLFIDTTQKTCNLCIFGKTKIHDKISVDTNNNLTDIVVELIDKLLKKNKIKKTDIKNIYLTLGPGSFTGVRVGTLISKAWAVLNKANIYTIDSLLLQVINSGVSILDARGNKFYTGVFKNDKKIGEYQILDLENVNKIAKTKKLNIFKDYEQTNIYECLILHIMDFKLTKIDSVKPLYIKPAVTK